MLVLFSVLVPAVCLLWFMDAAIRNERLAARQRLGEIYRAQLASARSQLHQHWAQRVKELEQLVAAHPAPAAFARGVRSGLVDSVLIFDERGRLRYPNSPSGTAADFGDLESKWQEARHLEHLRRHSDAAQRYHTLAQEAADTHLAARALQAETRCLVQAGKPEAALALVQDVLGTDRYCEAADAQGRLIAANAELLALELSTNRNSTAFRTIAQRLAGRLADYDNRALAASQRRFLMSELRRFRVEGIELDTATAEQLAADWTEAHGSPAASPALQVSVLPGFWQFATADRRALGLIGPERLAAWAKAALGFNDAAMKTEVQLVPPHVDASDAEATLPVGESWPGWRLALSLQEGTTVGVAAKRQMAIYLWTGILMLSVAGALTFLALRLVRRQLVLAQLKSDLAATVSHELKTPVAAIRVLVDTLLEAEDFDSAKTREYLQLIAQENERLGRVGLSFLAFSRMQRSKHTFQFAAWPVRQMAEAALETVRSRYPAQGFQFDLEISDQLPPIQADWDALVTALVNLLDNGCKYSGDSQRIVLRAYAEDGCVVLAVKDNGIGISRRDRKRIFQPFYQADERLSRRAGGCGLGLSIVQFIARAHGGRVSVESHPGRGSTFFIRVPAAQTTAAGPGARSA